MTKLVARLVLAALAAALPACTSSYAPPAGGGTIPAVPSSLPAASTADMARQVVDLVNAHRAGRGCPALTWDDAAARAAQQHSDDMARRNYFAHNSPEGQTPMDRLRAQGASYHALAENIAWGQRTAQEVVQGWLASPGHRQNIENCVYRLTGVGYRDGRWTQVFYAP